MNFPPRLNPLRGTMFAWLLPLTWAMAEAAAIAVPTTVEVFLRHRFGARSGIALVKGAIVLLVAYAASSRERPVSVPLFPGFLFAYVVLATGQWLTGRLRPQEQVHSYSSGEPWPLWQQLPVARTTVKRYLEPVLLCLFSWIISVFDPALADWLFLAAIALFIKEQVFRARARTRRLDALDNRVDTNDYAPGARTEPEPFVEARQAPPRPRAQHGRRQPPH